ncbi:MAG: oxygenase MpaB family protein [Propionibacteriales bacterium]|nr:oxygenase MpaB family protein [Propionibacteriales bacterium]
MTAETTPDVDRREWRAPTHFRYWEARDEPAWRSREKLVKKLFGHELFPTDEHARFLLDDLYGGDPVAERFVAEVFSGPGGHQKGRAMLTRALADGIDAVEDAPQSMKDLFAEFDTVPDWVDRDQVELGAEIWRRWGTMLFNVAGVITLEIYTESGVATPLSLAGGYAGDNALRRFLESCKFWIDTSEAEALFTPGSEGRTTAMLVRIMHVAVRKRVEDHPEWDSEKWGLPISQTYMMLTQIGGSIAPAMALWVLGYQTTPKEMRALLHFNQYQGHLLGVQPQWRPTTVRDCLQVLAMSTAARSYDSGQHGKELIESFPAAFAPRPGQTRLQRLRSAYSYRIIAAYCGVWMAPATRKPYDLPRAFPWVLILVLRWPLITVTELLRRLPGLGGLHNKVMVKHRRSWYEAQMEGREAAFDASSGLRR